MATCASGLRCVPRVPHIQLTPHASQPCCPPCPQVYLMALPHPQVITCTSGPCHVLLFPSVPQMAAMFLGHHCTPHAPQLMPPTRDAHHVLEGPITTMVPAGLSPPSPAPSQSQVHPVSPQRHLALLGPQPACAGNGL